MDQHLYDLADQALERASRMGVKYAEARLQGNYRRSVTLRNGSPDPPSSASSLGIGVRVLVGSSLAFGSTNRLTPADVGELVESLVRDAGAFSSSGSVMGMSREDQTIAVWRADEGRRLEDVSHDDMMAEASALDSAIMEAGEDIVSRWLSLSTSVEEKYFANSEGSRIISRVPRLFAYALITGKDGDRVVQRTIESGGSGGWELVDSLDLEGRFRKEAKDLLEIVKRAEPADLSDVRSVIVSPEISGIMAHESVGHPFEADRILGREAAQAGGSYVRRDMMGAKVGGPGSFVSDDPTVPHSYGFYLYDDEGVRAKRKRLMLAGTVNEFLHDRETAYEFAVKSNASARASSYDREPIPRMSNTFVEPGDYKLEELMEEAGRALLIESYMEWNIDDKRENQRYVGLRSYLVEGGEVKGLVFNPVLEVTSSRLWSSVVARGRDLEFYPGTCGKGEPMQGVPVWLGGPYMLLRDMSVRTRVR